MGFPRGGEGFLYAAAGWSAASLSYWRGDINAAVLCRRRLLQKSRHQAATTWHARALVVKCCRWIRSRGPSAVPAKGLAERTIVGYNTAASEWREGAAEMSDDLKWLKWFDDL
jgi:hypothetical protein